MQAIPTPSLVVVEATLALGVLIELLDGPACASAQKPTVSPARKLVAALWIWFWFLGWGSRRYQGKIFGKEDSDDITVGR